MRHIHAYIAVHAKYVLKPPQHVLMQFDHAYLMQFDSYIGAYSSIERHARSYIYSAIEPVTTANDVLHTALYGYSRPGGFLYQALFMLAHKFRRMRRAYA